MKMLFTAICIFLVSGPSFGQSSSEAVKGIKKVVEAWNRFFDERPILLAPCIDNSWFGYQFEKGARIKSYDVRATTSLISPYRGIIEFTSSVEGNWKSPNANGASTDVGNGNEKVCFKTRLEAVQDPNFKYGNFSYHGGITFELYYNLQDDGHFVLSGGNNSYEFLLKGSIINSLKSQAAQFSRIYSIPIN